MRYFGPGDLRNCFPLLLSLQPPPQIMLSLEPPPPFFFKGIFGQFVSSYMQVHDMQSPKKDEQEKDTLESSLQDLVQNQEREADNEICEIVEDDKIVPIVIRPGHIRFEPLEEGEVVCVCFCLYQHILHTCLDLPPLI